MSNRVRSAGDGGRAARAAVGASIKQRLRARANELSDIAKDMHRTAPRGGDNVNRFGERRSAPGEPPAMETGELFAAIDQGVEVKANEATVVVNSVVLEHGTRTMDPRPLGREAVAELKRRVRDGE